MSVQLCNAGDGEQAVLFQHVYRKPQQLRMGNICARQLLSLFVHAEPERIEVSKTGVYLQYVTT